MSAKVCVAVLALAALIGNCSGLRKEVMFGRMPICDHMSDVPVCPLSYQPICGTDKTTYSNDCLLCVARMKTKKDIQILREGPC